MIDAIISEFHIRVDELSNHKVSSIYFGGGTPSLLSDFEVEKILSTIRQLFKLENNIEITFELNPENIQLDYLKALYQFGVNRWSVGIQSFSDVDLELMGRVHDSKQAKNALDILSSANLGDYSLDLIYGVPNSNIKSLEQNLSIATQYDASHISVYALTIEEKTKLSRQVIQQEIHEKSQEQFELEYQLICDSLSRYEYEHYEISNFSKKNKNAIHNSNYWSLKPYFGFGPSAHSFDGSNMRYWNIANNQKYLKSIFEDHLLPTENEHLESKDIFNELLMLGLRTKNGCDLEIIENRCGTLALQYLTNKIKNNRYIKKSSKNIYLLEKDWLICDGIVRDLMMD